MLFSRSRGIQFLDLCGTRVLYPRNSNARKPISIFFRHTVDLVLVFASKESAEGFKWSGQNFNHSVAALLGRSYATCIRPRVLENVGVRISFALDGGCTPHCRDGNGQDKSY